MNRGSILRLLYRWHGDHLFGIANRQRNELLVAEGFFRRMVEPGYEERLADLLAAIDPEGREVVRKVLKRWRYILTHNLMFRAELFDAAEVALQKKQTQQKRQLAAQLGLSATAAEASVLYYHHGLQHTTLADELRPRLQRGDVIDVGASWGDSAYIFAKLYGASAVHSFEPRADRLNWLAEFRRRHDLEAMRIVPGGLGRTDGPWPDGTPAQTLDSYVDTNGVRVGVIKMDVEGAEAEVLEGARATIQTQRPLLIVSMYHNSEQFFGLQPLIATIRSDYRFAVRKLDDGSPVYETTLFCY